MTSSRFRVLTAAVASLVISVGLAATPAQAAPRMAITDLSFSSATVDATESAQAVQLTWRVTNTDQRAITVTGLIELREFQNGAPVGPVRSLNFALRHGDADIAADWGGTAQDSTYRHEVFVPQYATTDSTSWRVTKVTAQDGRGHTAKLTADELVALGAQFTVTRLTDVQAPTLGTLSLDGRSEVYHDGSGLTLSYALSIYDVGLGFRRGTLVLDGPGDRQVSGTFEVRKADAWSGWCGENNYVSLPATWAYCAVTVAIAPDTPSGSWTVNRVRLVDEAGNVTVARDVDWPTVHVSRNEVVEAGDFSVTPDVVDNWRAARTVELRFRAQSWAGPIVKVEVRTEQQCWPSSTTPTWRPDGTASIPIAIPQSRGGCRVTGVAITDEAGNRSLYGEPYGAPALALVVAQLPDETPPKVLSVAPPKKVWTVSELTNSWGVSFTVQVDDTSGAPVTGFSTTLFNSLGHSVGGHSGGISEGDDGRLGLSTTVPPVVGEYVIGFDLTDAAGNRSAFGYPNTSTPEPPGGPLTITVVAD
ncbi:Ig-like domain repeat protein [Micromonospora sp. WMMD882]|uniref:Ig-like domain repeat protein n=1 Tax=Micromonospora sp. WMMD882 TaxID=3015151 RepID=UPI00248CFCA5|nr:Ig-like domain repeat protein [Micromonospora sp. WMMD882]WBB79361.1 Ig-like domain repeat protein [Micromonospora sp. WMMD882]